MIGKEVAFPIPNSEERPTIDSVLDEIQGQEFYINQMVHRRTILAKDEQNGMAFQFHQTH